MPFQIPFECEPFYMRPLLMVKELFGLWVHLAIHFLIPIAVGLAIIFVIAFLAFAILAALFGWDLGSDEDKGKRQKEKEEKENSEREQKVNQGKPDAEIVSSSLPVTAGGSNGTVDLEKRLQIELELLGEMVIARKERLEALKKMQVGGDASGLEVLGKVE
jgi:flagellar biosynthesis component FlhA